LAAAGEPDAGADAGAEAGVAAGCEAAADGLGVLPPLEQAPTTIAVTASPTSSRDFLIAFSSS